VLLRLVGAGGPGLATEVGTRRLGCAPGAASETDVVDVRVRLAAPGRGPRRSGPPSGSCSSDLLAGRPFRMRWPTAPRLVASASAEGDGPRLVTPRIPVASVTGTNGKTTTTRLLAHICMTAG
jgi:cyanophycin synthetase